MSELEKASTDAGAEAQAIAGSFDGSAELTRVAEAAEKSATALRKSAEQARRSDEHELSGHLERYAAVDEARVLEANELLRIRRQAKTQEGDQEGEVSTASRAPGDGANDAEVSPDSDRGTVRRWPGF